MCKQTRPGLGKSYVGFRAIARRVGFGFVVLHAFAWTVTGLVGAELTACVQSDNADPEQTLELPSFAGRATISVRGQVRHMADLDIRVVFECTRGGRVLYNPFLDRSFPLPCRISLYDLKGDCVGSLLSPQSRQAACHKDAWIDLQCGQCVGGTVRLRVRRQRPDGSILCVWPRNVTGRSLELQPGTYRIQAQYLNRLIAIQSGSDGVTPEPPRRISDEKWLDRELFRSNLVEIQVGNEGQ